MFNMLLSLSLKVIMLGKRELGDHILCSTNTNKYEQMALLLIDGSSIYGAWTLILNMAFLWGVWVCVGIFNGKKIGTLMGGS